jgi:anthranilate phosphoribosyltransferase
MTTKAALAKLIEGHDLTREEAQAAMRDMASGEATPAQISAFAVALRMKGETAEEIAGLFEVMRELVTRVDVGEEVVDVVGTGGDGAHTINISTISAFVVASAGARVAKHGNRSITSRCGSADFLEGLGIAIDLSADGVARCVREAGFGFMFAPGFHPVMRHVGPPRREIGVRTVFNVLGPITNPAFATRQLTGVATPGLGTKLAEVMKLVGTKHALFVHSEDGLDEMSLAAPTQVAEVKDGTVTSYVITPEELGLPGAPTDAIRGGSVEENVAFGRAILAGEKGPKRDVILLNAGAGLYVAGLVGSIRAGIDRAAEELDSGRAAAKVQQIVEVSQRIKAESPVPA